MSLYDSVMGSGLVYDRLRPLLLGGFDFSRVYGWLETTAEDVVFDIGCGSGHALNYLKSYRSYYGFDLDGRALSRLRRRHPHDRFHTEERKVTADDVAARRPTKAILMGILHHLSESATQQLFHVLQGGTIARIITLDPVYKHGHLINNVLGFLDRGRHVRFESGYRDLIKGSGFSIRESMELRSGNELAHYFTSCLVPMEPAD